MSNKNLFKEAIADAKAVREAALVNAKAALEEALTPRLQSMLATKLNEIEYEMEEEGYIGEEELEEYDGFKQGDSSDEWADSSAGGQEQGRPGYGDLEEDFDISEILAELNEAKKEEEEEESEEDFNPKDPESIKDFIIATIEKMMDKEGGAEMHDEPDADNAGGPSDHDADNADEVPLDEEIDLEELLAELDEMGMDNKDDKDHKDLEEIDFGKIKNGLQSFGKGVSKQVFLRGGILSPDKIDKKTKRKIPVNTQEREKDWNSVNGDKEALEDMGYVFGTPSSGAGLGGSTSSGFGEAREMNEAIRTINTLRSELNEVNLLNAKLLYVNKIFKAKNLTESQKLKVIASFDKATTTREAKVVYESLNSTLTTATPKQAIKESLGFASRAAGVAPRKAIVETNDAITRMQKLANIIK